MEDERARLGDGTLGVLCPAAVEGELSAELARAGEAAPDDPVRTPRVSVLTVERAKGLEFDGVIVVAPDEIVAESVRGANDLYVALTRATRRLGVLHTGEPLPALSGDGSAQPGPG